MGLESKPDSREDAQSGDLVAYQLIQDGSYSFGIVDYNHRVDGFWLNGLHRVVVIVEQHSWDGILTRALDSLWRSIAEGFPEVTHGDMPPSAVDRLRDAAEKEVLTWLTFNYPLW